MFGVDVEVHDALDALFSGGPSRDLLLSETPLVFDRAGYTGETEPTAPSYSRITIDPADWPTASDRAVEVTVILPDPVDDLGVLPYWGLATGGVIRWAGRFASPLELPAGATNCSATVRVEAPSSFSVVP